jgi:hypothetical protein
MSRGGEELGQGERPPRRRGRHGLDCARQQRQPPRVPVGHPADHQIGDRGGGQVCA